MEESQLLDSFAGPKAHKLMIKSSCQRTNISMQIKRLRNPKLPIHLAVK
jgi:hypothetical protein